MPRLNRLPPAPISARSSSGAGTGTGTGTALSIMSSASQESARTPQSISSGFEDSVPAQNFLSPDILDQDKLYEAYLRSQKEVEDLKNENQILKARLADSQIQFVGATKVRKGTAGAPPGTDIELWKHIRKIAQNYQLFGNPFFDASFLSVARPDFKSNDPIRYTSVDHQRLGHTAELYEFMPKKYHYIMSVAQSTSGVNSSNFTHEFSTTVSTARSTAVHLVRQVVPSIFGIDGKYFTVSSTDVLLTRDQVPKIRKLLGHSIDNNSNVVYARFPPVLYLNPDDPKTEDRFLNPGLIKIARAVIFGKTAAENFDRAVARVSSGFLLPDVPPSTTVGLICTISVMTCYALSPDIRFDSGGIGAKTNINYRANFDFYKRYLIEAQAKHPRMIKALLDKWDQVIFLKHNKTKGSIVNEDGEYIEINDDSEMALEMQKLELVEDLPPDSDQPDKTASAPIDDQHITPELDDDNFSSMYTSEEEAAEPPIWVQDTPIQNAFSEEVQSDLESAITEPPPFLSVPPAAAPLPAPVPVPRQSRTTRTKHASDSNDPTSEATNNAATEPVKRARAAARGTRGRGRGSKTS